jgi:hypothetical protein
VLFRCRLEYDNVTLAAGAGGTKLASRTDAAVVSVRAIRAALAAVDFASCMVLYERWLDKVYIPPKKAAVVASDPATTL